MGPSMSLKLSVSNTQTESFFLPHSAATHIRPLQSKDTAAGQEPICVEKISTLLLPAYTSTSPAARVPVQILSRFMSTLTPADGAMVFTTVKVTPSITVRLAALAVGSPPA